MHITATVSSYSLLDTKQTISRIIFLIKKHLLLILSSIREITKQNFSLRRGMILIVSRLPSLTRALIQSRENVFCDAKNIFRRKTSILWQRTEMVSRTLILLNWSDFTKNKKPSVLSPVFIPDRSLV